MPPTTLDVAAGSSSSGRRARGFATYFVPVSIGVILVVAEIVMSMFPRAVFLGFDIVVFGVTAAFFARSTSRPWWLSAGLTAGPSLIWTLLALLAFLGPTKLREGVGSSWLISVALVPLSATIGAYLSHQFSSAKRN
jgi:hypothetical protein